MSLQNEMKDYTDIDIVDPNFVQYLKLNANNLAVWLIIIGAVVLLLFVLKRLFK